MSSLLSSQIFGYVLVTDFDIFSIQNNKIIGIFRLYSLMALLHTKNGLGSVRLGHNRLMMI